jgi:Fic family protein
MSYNRDFLDSYVPNKTAYVPEKVRKQLYKEGKRFDKTLAAGTYAREICQRLLIDLSYNSSRLEGNTYSLLDTQKLVEEGISAEGKVNEETVMIMNHKEAILFLVENAQEIELTSLTIRNLHHLLSQDLLANPEACGNIRSIEVDIGQSTYKPLNNPHQLKELFELILLKARKIEDPFEQSFFLLVHLSYLQAFEDVNKRTSRLSCNIPFIKENLCPLSFTDVSRDDYTTALLAVYEKNNVEPMLELYAWAYLRSCKQYGVVKKSLGEIDAFRIQYRQQRKEVMGLVVKKGLHGKPAEDLIEDFCKKNGINETAKFTAMTLADLSTLHAGAIVGLGITEVQLNKWLEKKA